MWRRNSSGDQKPYASLPSDEIPPHPDSLLSVVIVRSGTKGAMLFGGRESEHSFHQTRSEIADSDKRI